MNRRTYALCSWMCLAVTASVVASMLVATPSDAIIPPPTTSTTVPRPRPTTTTTTTTTTAPATTLPPSTTTATTPPIPSTPSTPPSPPTTQQADDVESQPFELPCIEFAVDDSYTTAFDEVLTIPLEAGLLQNDGLCGASSSSVQVPTPPAHGTLTVEDYGAFVYTPEPGFDGSVGFDYWLLADGDVVDAGYVKIMVQECSAVAFADGFHTDYDTALSIDTNDILANDLNTCQLVKVVAPSTDSVDHGTLVETQSGLEYQPAPGFEGLDKFHYELRHLADDDTVEFVMATGVVSIWVDAPTCVALPDDYTVPAAGAFTIPAPGVLGNDSLCPGFGGVAIEAMQGQGLPGDTPHGYVSGPNDDGSFSYDPDPGYVGLDYFTYVLLDDNVPESAWATATVYLDVLPACDVLLVDDAYQTPADTDLYAPPPGPAANDALCDPTDELEVLDGPGHGSLTLLAGGDMTYTPDGGFVGTDTYTYTVASAVAAGIQPPPQATVTIEVVGGGTTTTSTSTTTTEGTTGSEPPTPTIPDTSPATTPDSLGGLNGGVRIATFDAALSRAADGELVEDLSTPDDPQAANVAEIIQRTRPDMILLNDFDYVEGGAAVELFADNYLAVSQNGADPIDYPYSFVAPVNGGDFPGQHGMVLLSRFPIPESDVRTFQNLAWASMPEASVTDDPAMPLSSTSHWDVPVDVDGRVIHVLAANPGPPSSDGVGDRTADEIRFWAEYVGGEDTAWIVDDAGVSGGLDPGAEFVIAGDLNSDPVDGDSVDGIDGLLAAGGVQDPAPTSAGAVAAAAQRGQANETHVGDPALDTADLADDGSGNLRTDYVLPSAGLDIAGAGVFWPVPDDELSRLVTTDPLASSGHRLVWVDVV